MSTAAAAAASAAGPDEAWSVVRTPGDGSCLFHAVEITAGTPATDLRAVAADAVSAHADAEFNGAEIAAPFIDAYVPNQPSARQKAAGSV